MRVNGQQVISKSIVVGPGDRAEIELPSGLVPIAFKSDAAGPRLTFEGDTIVFYNFDNSLGQGGVVSLNTPDGATMPFRVIVHAIGEASSMLRTLHYTAG